MQIALWSALTSALLLPLGAVAGEPVEEETQKALRSVAQMQLSGPLVKFTKPSKEIRGDTLVYSFGSVSALAEPAIVLQLRVELLRKFSFFEEKQTALMLSELESVVGRYLTVRNQVDQEHSRRTNPKLRTPEEQRLDYQLRALEGEFDQVLKKHVMDYAEQNRFNLRIGNAFGDGEYLYIDKKRRQRREISFDTMVRVVVAQFDEGRVTFVRPSTEISRGTRDRDAIWFNPGEIRGLEASHLAVADLFRLELLRRYPNVDEALFKKHYGRIVAEMKEAYEKQRSLPFRAPESGLQTRLVRSLEPLYEEAARLKGMDLYGPAKAALPPSRVKIELADEVSRVVFAPALDFMLAKNDMSKVPVARRRTAINGDKLSIEPGVYIYELVLKMGGVRRVPEGFDIPQKITRDGRLPLR